MLNGVILHELFEYAIAIKDINILTYDYLKDYLY